jgi:O-antigen/teichoic acid export membrane protein
VQVLSLGWFSKAELQRQGIRLTLHGLGGETRLLGTFILPAAMAGLTAMPAQWLASSFLARESGGFGELALFSAGLTIRNLVLFLPGVVSSVGASVLNAERGRKAVAGSREAFLGTLRTTTIVAATAGLPIILLARPLLRLFGSSFVGGVPALRLLVVSAVLEAVAIVVYQIPVATGRMWILLMLVILPRDLALSLLGWALTPAHGAVGLAVAWLISQFLAVGLGILCAVLVLRAESKGRSGETAS